MPLYEDRANAQNRIQVPEEVGFGVTLGSDQVYARMMRAVGLKREQLRRRVVVALDGWYGVDWDAIVKGFQAACPGLFAETVAFSGCFKDADAIAEYKKPFLTDDPAFGYVNENGRVEEILDLRRIESLRETLNQAKGNALVYGFGAATKLLSEQIDLIVYFDKTRQPILWQMWSGELVPFGADGPDKGYGWKEYYYCDYHLLDHQKEYLYDKMDFWVEAISPDSLKMLTREAYDTIVTTLLKYPIKEIKIYQPGPWGAYRYRDLFDVPGLECNAWNELAGPELGIIVELDRDTRIEMPLSNLMQYQAQLLGPYLAEKYPRLFPMDVWLDDGYFPEKTPIERTAMPIHVHPSTDYVKRHFNEPLGRYETYYICEAYEGAQTIMGYKEDCDLESWEDLARDSENLKEIKDWKDYFNIWDSNIGDLYLIPPGTAHGHGGNQMVLEMDTCPSIAATEYSFFEYDFARNSWDDEKKAMTGKPMKMHSDHAFNTERWRRKNWVRENLLARPKVVKWTKDFKLDRYASLPEMPFEIERLHFYTRAEYDTGLRFAHVLTLTIGHNAIVRSKSDPEKYTDINLFQSTIVPASFGEYEVVSRDGDFCEVVILRWKDPK